MRTLNKPVNAGTHRALPAAFTAVGLSLALLLAPGAQTQETASRSDRFVPAEQTAAAVADPDWKMPRMSWGDPDLQGTYTSRDMSGIPMERPEQYGMHKELTPEQFRERVQGGTPGLAALAENQDNQDRLQLSALDSAETGTRTFGYTSYVIEPENGRIPALTPEGKEHQMTVHRGQSNPPYHDMEDFSYYDRCITRGITGSILPSLYGDAMRIVQSPTEVAISYEMLHDTRIIPLDGRPPADRGVRQYMGSSVGHWEGDTLVVETTNLTDELTVGRMPHSEDIKLTERFTRIDPDMINYVVHVEDPRTFKAPWTFRLTLTTQPGYKILEYSCHEGNYFVANALRAEKRYQEKVAEAKANGEPIPERSDAASGLGLEIYDPPSADEAVNINAED